MTFTSLTVLASTPKTSIAARGLRWQLLWHRGWQRLGWPGMVGLVLLLSALVVGVLAWQSKRMLMALESTSHVRAHAIAGVSSATTIQAARQTMAPTVALPKPSEIHALMGQIQNSAAEQRLTWQAVDYRYKAATAQSLARLEVHGRLHGPYKPLRLWLTRLRADVPGMVLQEAQFTRPNVDVAEVDAKLMLVFALADTPLGLMGSDPTVSMALKPSASAPAAPQTSAAEQ